MLRRPQSKIQFTHSLIETFLESGAMLGEDANSMWIGWGEFDRFEQKPADAFAFFAPDFYLSEPQPWWVPEFYALVERKQLLTQLKEWLTSQSRPLTRLDWREPEATQFQAVFNFLKTRIADGEIRKAVPAIYATAPASITRESRASMIASLCDATVTPYGLWNSHGGLLGATPELLFRLDRAGDSKNYDLVTMALAGTRPVTGGTPDELAQSDHEFLNDPKERFEHLVVLEDLVRALSPLGEVEVGETGVMRLPHLRHLRTPIRAHLRESMSFERAVASLHPTPALGVDPRERGLSWIRAWDKWEDRGRFGAPFGAIGPDCPGRCWVAIRNVQWDEHQSVLGSGCGIVAASAYESEWRELASKRRSVRLLLGLEERGLA